VHPKKHSFFSSLIVRRDQAAVIDRVHRIEKQFPDAYYSQLHWLKQALRDVEDDAEQLADVMEEAYSRLLRAAEPHRKSMWADEIAWYRAEAGRSFFEALVEAREIELEVVAEEEREARANPTRIYWDRPVYLVHVYSRSDCCPPCRRLGGTSSVSDMPPLEQFTVEEAKARRILPHPACVAVVGDQPGFCRCCYRSEYNYR
jgi:hypothetical protein